MTDRPVSGKWLEELTPGLVIPHAIRRTVTEADNVMFTTMSMNPAWLHLDFDYATNERLHKALELKLFEDQKDTIKLTSLVSNVVDEETQQKIVSIIRKLEDQGEIVVARSGEDEMVI